MLGRKLKENKERKIKKSMNAKLKLAVLISNETSFDLLTTKSLLKINKHSSRRHLRPKTVLLFRSLETFYISIWQQSFIYLLELVLHF